MTVNTVCTIGTFAHKKSRDGRQKMTPGERLHRMRQIRGTDTAPEMAVRRMVHSLGHRYRIHAKDVSGRPDLVFRKRKKLIFVHGCFWHSHQDCPNFRAPKANTSYLGPKLEKNRLRDARVNSELRSDGWKILVVWECEIHGSEALKLRLQHFLKA